SLNHSSSAELSSLSLHAALPILRAVVDLALEEAHRLSVELQSVVDLAGRELDVSLVQRHVRALRVDLGRRLEDAERLVELLRVRSEEHKPELQSRGHLVCRLLPE